LHDPSPDVRRTAAHALGKVGVVEAVPALVASLRDADPIVRQYSAWALGAIGEPALNAAGTALVAALNDPAPAVARAAASAIGQIGATQSVIELLDGALRATDVQTRRAAATALGWLDEPASYPTVVRALRDPDAAVRQAAVAALGELADPRAIPAVIERLKIDPDPGVRNEAAYRLGKFGDPRAIPTLKQAAGQPSTARWAVWALREIEESAEEAATLPEGASAS